MKKLLISGVMLSLMAGTALAADLGVRAPVPAPAYSPVPAAFTWTGFYAGINAGYGFGTQDRQVPTVVGVPAAAGLFATPAGTADSGVLAFSNSRSSNDGFAGGGQIGYNYQFGLGSGVVIGVEADAQYVDFGRDRNTFNYVTTNPLSTQSAGSVIFNPNGQSGLDYFGTVRGRLGYAFDRVLVYGTGGYAYGSGGGRDFGLPNRSRDDFQTGYAVGGGLEYALPTNSFLNFFNSSAVTLKVEGLYVNLDQGRRNDGTFAVNPAGNAVGTYSPGVVTVSSPARRNNDTEFAVVRAGLNYKFGTLFGY